MGLLRYGLQRLLLLVPTWIGITLITFVIIQLAPGDPADAGLVTADHREVDEDDIERLRELWGFDRPLLVQYGDWLWGVIRFDFGRSIRDQRPVSEKILERLPATLSLTLAAWLLALAVAVPIGVAAARRAGQAFDRVSSTLMMIFYATPSFALAIVLLLIFSVELKWLPLYGRTSQGHEDLSFWARMFDYGVHLLLPAVCLALGSIAYYARFIRDITRKTLAMDYVRTARAKGLDERTVVVRHALRNAMIPVVTLMGVVLPGLFSGAVVLEMIFSWPGMGSLLVEAMFGREYYTIMGLSCCSSFLVLIMTLVADLAYAWVDPRVSHG